MKKIKIIFILSFLFVLTGFALNINNFLGKIVYETISENLLLEKNIPKIGLKPMLCYTPKTNNVLLTELWSSPSTWGGAVPIAGQNVTIPANKHIILDIDSPDLAGLTINGILELDRTNLNLTADWIMVMGRLQIGTPALPFLQKATITLNATNISENIMQMGTRGIMVMGGNLELHGSPPNKTWTKLNAHSAQGSTSLSLLEAVNWKINDEIVVAPTDYIGTGDTQKVSINAITGTNISTSTGMNAQRWGVLQYATSTGMSLTAGALPNSVIAGTPTTLDERAEVGNLTRNIVIQAPNDALWQNNNFGCHIMIMRQGAMQGVAHINGIEIKRGGQNGITGRYPFHWHMLSYEGSTTLQDATGQYIRNSSVNQSMNRGIVIHGTNGVEVSKNVVYNIKGHGIFTEDASERRNTIDGNLVLHIRDPLTPLKAHENGNITQGSAGMWISNPDNIITNNTVAGSTGNGFWFAFTTQAWGLSQNIVMDPSKIFFGVFDNNIAHSNEKQGLMFDDVESDNLGNTVGNKYVSTTDGLEPQWPYPNRRRHMLSNYSVWKNSRSGIWNRATIPDNDQAISADNCSTFFSGAGDDGLIKRCLLIGTSLNYNMNGMTRPTTYGSDAPVGLASYHSTFNIQDNLIINFPAVANTPSGAFSLNDYYLIPVDKGLIRNVNNTLINSHPGVRSQPSEPQFTFGALWDANDYWGGTATEDNYYVFNTPFFTYGQTPRIVQPSPAVSGGVLVQGPFYGFGDFVINNGNSPYYPLMEIQVDRLNNSMTTVGNLTVAEGANGQLLANMRHFATHPSGIYDLKFPTLNNVNDIILTVSNMLTPNDYQVLAVDYNGNYKIDGLFSSLGYNDTNYGENELPPADLYTHIYAPVNNISEVINSTNGEVYWQDRASNKVWFKVRGGLNPGDSNSSAISDYNLYKRFSIRVYGTSAPLSSSSSFTTNNNFKVFPNPTSSELNLIWNNFSNTNNSILVHNSLGQVIYKNNYENKIGENQLKIDSSNWTSGIYFVKVDNNVIKIIKQ